MYDRGLQYTTIAAAKSVLSGVLHIPGVTSSHPLIIRLLKGIFHVRPPKPGYEFIWDTELVLNFFVNFTPFSYNSQTSSEDSYPLDFIVRATGEHTPPVSQLQRNPKLIFNIQALLKHSRPTKRDLPITYHAFRHDVALCPVTALDAYLNAREKLENAALHDELFICYRKPRLPATKDTLARWVKMVLHSSSVYLDTYSAHSCRSTSTSKAAATGVPLEKILMAGQWSTSSTFYTVYRKDIVVTGRLPGPQFASGLLTQNAT